MKKSDWLLVYFIFSGVSYFVARGAQNMLWLSNQEALVLALYTMVGLTLAQVLVRALYGIYREITTPRNYRVRKGVPNAKG